MRTLRLLLVLGLAFHKLLWEIMKGETVPEPPTRASSTRLAKRVLKMGKAGVLAFLVLQTLLLNVFSISRHPFLLRLVGLAVYAVGLLLAVAGRLQLGNNWSNIEDGHISLEHRLVTHGVYSYIRHPIYMGDLLLLVGLELALNSWLVLFTVVPGLVVLRQISTEEQSLARRFQEYQAYRQATKRLVPFLY